MLNLHPIIYHKIIQYHVKYSHYELKHTILISPSENLLKQMRRAHQTPLLAQFRCISNELWKDHIHRIHPSSRMQYLIEIKSERHIPTDIILKSMFWKEEEVEETCKNQTEHNANGAYVQCFQESNLAQRQLIICSMASIDSIILTQNIEIYVKTW